MCWFTSKTPELKIAKEDITTFKVVLKKNDLLIPYFGYNMLLYKFNKLNPLVNLNPECLYNIGRGRYVIEKGYHSYSKSCEWRILSTSITINNDTYHNSFNCTCCLVSCIIPKGTKYYVNECNEYVSEQIIIKNTIIV